MPGNPRTTDTTGTPAGAQLLAVYRDDAAADRAADALQQAGILSHRADEGEIRAGLRAEMKQETVGMAAGPGVPTHNREQMLASLPATLGLSILGGLAFALLSLLIDIPDVSTAQEVLWFAVIGVFAVGTVAYLLGGSLGSRMANRPPAVQRGATLVVEDGSQETADLLRDFDPIRVDRRAPDGSTAVIVTEDELHPGLRKDRAMRNIRGTDRADD